MIISNTEKDSALLDSMECAHNYNDHLIELILQRSGGSRHILDHGAGRGTHAKKLQNLGYPVHCVEPNDCLRDELRKNGLTAFRDMADVPDGYYELIYTFNVLEHIENDSAEISRMRQKLGHEGILLVFVPAFELLWTGLDEHVGHRRRYSMKNLCDLVEVNGFAVEDKFYVDSLGFLASLAFKSFRSARSVPGPKSIKFYDRFVFPLSRRLDQILKTRVGKNVFLACKKI